MTGCMVYSDKFRAEVSLTPLQGFFSPRLSLRAVANYWHSLNITPQAHVQRDVTTSITLYLIKLTATENGLALTRYITFQVSTPICAMFCSYKNTATQWVM